MVLMFGLFSISTGVSVSVCFSLSCAIQAKELVENTPATIMKDVKKDEAEEMASKFEELGAEVELE